MTFRTFRWFDRLSSAIG